MEITLAQRWRGPGKPAEFNPGPDESHEKSREIIRLLKQCTSLELGKQLHHRVRDLELETDLLVASQLIRMYLSCGRPDSARVAFNDMNKQEPGSWNAAISEFSKAGRVSDALSLYERMTEVGYVLPNDVTYLTVLKAVEAHAEGLRVCREIHANVVQHARKRKRNTLHPCVGAALMNVFGKHGCFREANSIFQSMHFRDNVSWSTAILNAVRNAKPLRARTLFSQMLLDGMKPNEYVFANLLGSFTGPEHLREGRVVHTLVLERGLQNKVVLATSLVSMYGRCGSSLEAWRVFRGQGTRDVVAYNAMIVAYSCNNESARAMKIYHILAGNTSRCLAKKLEPNRATFLAVLSGLSGEKCLSDGRLVHGEILKRGFDGDEVVVAALVGMYGRCLSTTDARKVFEGVEISVRSTVLWNAMMKECVRNGEDDEAILLFERMQLEGAVPDKVTIVLALDACASLSDLVRGRKLHYILQESGYALDEHIVTALVDMYGKCGDSREARNVFEAFRKHGVVLWSCLVSACSRSVEHRVAFEVFREMLLEGVTPGDVSVLGVLSAYTHAGLLEEACALFGSITYDYGLEVTEEELGCMVNLLRKRSWFREANMLLNKIPTHGN